MREYVLNRPDGAAMRRALADNRMNAAGAILRLAWLAGLLREEIQLLTWAQVDLAGGQPAAAGPGGPPGAGAVGVAGGAAAARATARRTGWPCRTGTGRPLAAQSISRLARTALDAEGLTAVRLIDLRHDFVVRQLAEPRLAVRLPHHGAGGGGHERPFRRVPAGEKGLHPRPPGGPAPDRRVRPVEAAAGGAAPPPPGRRCG